MRVLLVGINPGLISAREGYHFANPANGFWRLLHESGFTPRRLLPPEQRELLSYGIGLTNLVARESRGVADLTAADLARGRAELTRTIRRVRPRAVVFVGITVYRAFVGRSSLRVRAGLLPEPVEGAVAFVVPNPSGRNAHFRYADMLAIFRETRAALAERGILPPPAG